MSALDFAARSWLVGPLCDELRAALSEDQVSLGADDRTLHGSDESWHEPAPPDVVVYPASSADVVAIVGCCRRHGAPLIPFGAGTSLEGHVAAPFGGVTVDMSRMNRIVELSVPDLLVTVQAGVTRLQLDAALRPEGVFFPVDPGADATLGGMIATGASGTTTVRYGAMRENVVSLEVVTAAGEIVRTRSRAPKSSAGYDLTRLFVGSEGTLGIITEATLRVQPTPETMAAAVCSFSTFEHAVACVIEIRHAAVPIARVELLDELVVEAMNRRAERQLAVAPTLLFEFHGSPDEVRLQVEAVEALAREHDATGFFWPPTEGERRELWRARHDAYNAVRALRPGTRAFTTDVCVPISQLSACVLETRADIAAHGLLAPIVGHVGDGNFHVLLLFDPDDAQEREAARAFNERVVERALAAGGTCTGEHGVGYGKAPFLLREHGAPAVELMRTLKSALDPLGLLNPGKLTQALDGPPHGG